LSDLSRAFLDDRIGAVEDHAQESEHDQWPQGFERVVLLLSTLL
jgi:hypothetical protein